MDPERERERTAGDVPEMLNEISSPVYHTGAALEMHPRPQRWGVSLLSLSLAFHVSLSDSSVFLLFVSTKIVPCTLHRRVIYTRSGLSAMPHTLTQYL